MPSMFTTTLALAALFGAVSAQQMHMVVSDFDAAAYNQMLDCVKETGNAYDVAVDNGRTIIVPVEGKTIDIDSDDEALGKCLDIHSLSVKLAVDDSRDQVSGKPIEPLGTATAEWAQSNGAEGITSQDGTISARGEERGPLAGSLLAARAAAKGYYYAHGSFEKKCHSPGSIVTNTNTCKSQMGAYTSIQFGNADPTHSLRVSLWPHHDCAANHNDNGRRTISVAANHDSACQEKTTYSWNGKYT